MAKIVDFDIVTCDEILFESTSFQAYGYGIVSQLPMKDREMSIQAKGVYSYLVSCAGNDKQTYPTQKKMCYDLNIKKVDTLAKYIREIQSRGYIKIIKTKKGNLHYRNVYLIATDTRTMEIWKREFEEGKEIEEAEVITENKKSLTYGEVKDNDLNNLNDTNSISENDKNDNSNSMEKENIYDIAYCICLNDIEGFESMEDYRKEFFINTTVSRLLREGV